MPKNIEDFIVPERRRSIRNIPIPEGRRKTDLNAPLSSPDMSGKITVDSLERPTSPVVGGMPTTHIVPEEPSYSPPPPRRILIPYPKHSHKRLWLSLGASAIILGFIILSMMSGATLSYVPRSANLTFANEVHTAKKTAEIGLIYSVVKLSGDKGAQVSVSGEEEVSRKASGTIIVYNDAATEPRRLIENTRFESPTGKIYRIQNAITIPGKKLVSGVSQPGSIEVTVYADAPGDSYNTGLTDFTVPGLKGTPRYSTIYARSKTPMAGGFVGKEKVVNADDMAKAKSLLQAALSEELLAKAEAEVPADFILFPSLSSLTFEDLPQSSSSNSKAIVNMRGHLYGIMFKKSDLAKELAAKKATIASGEVVEMGSFEGLQVSFAGTPPADLLPLNEISFRVSGKSELKWHTDEVSLKADLLGKKKSDIPNILKNYPTISSATASIRPFWKSSFPTDGDKVTIKELSVE